MPVRSALVLSVVLLVGIAAQAQMPAFDTILTAAGDIVITPIGHASLGFDMAMT